mmetsp:Transcript_27331/g.69556  ORF Transcript_27331/g.69556 Transcript_27331/m.69556 type:complete len:88 (-) Transcript_27331:152-415(-)
MTAIMFRGGTYVVNEKVLRVQVPWKWTRPPWKVFGPRLITRWRSQTKTLETWQEVATRIEATAKLAEDRRCARTSLRPSHVLSLLTV